MTKIHIINEIMGGGKTSAMITEMRNRAENKFIYLTPSLKETERVSNACPELAFCLPTSNKDSAEPDPTKPNSKSMDYEYLLEHKHNICATHKLFFMQSGDVCQYYDGYKLVIDEAPNLVVQSIDLGDEDTDIFYKSCLSFENGEKAEWGRSASYSGIFSDYKKICDKGFMNGISSDKKSYLYEIFPPEILRKFEDIYILTYLPEYQNFYYYLKDNDFSIDYLYVKEENGEYSLTSEPQPRKYFDYSELIEFVGGPKNKYYLAGEGRYNLSKSAYKNGNLRRTMRSNLRNFYTSVKATADDFMWTVFKEYKDSISDGRFNTSFLSCNSKSTNDYGNRHVVAYLINLFQKPANSYYYKAHGIKALSTGFSLTEMLQFIWRSAIRNGEKIKLYIPSKRMRDLLISWIDYAAGRTDSIEGLFVETYDEPSPKSFEDFYVSHPAIINIDTEISSIFEDPAETYIAEAQPALQPRGIPYEGHCSRSFFNGVTLPTRILVHRGGK